jgi:hypothetical protein
MVFDRYGIHPHIFFGPLHTAAIKCHLKVVSNEKIGGVGVASTIPVGIVFICGWADGNSLSFFEAAILYEPGSIERAKTN